MSNTKSDNAPVCNTLNFFYDNDNGSALTSLVNGIRFHVFVDYDSLKSTNGKRNSIEQNYLELLEQLRVRDEPDSHHGESRRQETEETKPRAAKQASTRDSARGSSVESINTTQQPEQDAELYCICRQPERGFMIGCDGGCENWYHGKCVGIEESDDSIPETYVCPNCEGKNKASTENRDSCDSGIDMGEDSDDLSEKEANSRIDELDRDPEQALQNWILAPLAEEIQKYAPASNAPQKQTVHEWYNAKTHFYSLELSRDKSSIHAIEQKATPELQSRMTALLPTLEMPKYILNLPIPWLHADSLTVLTASAEPEPFHPALVRHHNDNSTSFLKPVDPSQPGPTKREIKLLAQIARLKIPSFKLRIPQVLGLLASGKSKTAITGFLQTAIESPTPLTLKLSTSVPQELRDRWAKEAEGMVKLLHEHGIVWGDAKADNFVVDRWDRLWIIDFGGSYTEGWVDAELNETESGDQMGLEKIVNALDDPVNNTFDEDEDEEEHGERKRGREDEEEDELESPSKRQKR